MVNSPGTEGPALGSGGPRRSPRDAQLRPR